MRFFYLYACSFPRGNDAALAASFIYQYYNIFEPRNTRKTQNFLHPNSVTSNENFDTKLELNPNPVNPVNPVKKLNPQICTSYAIAFYRQ